MNLLLGLLLGGLLERFSDISLAPLLFELSLQFLLFSPLPLKVLHDSNLIHHVFSKLTFQSGASSGCLCTSFGLFSCFSSLYQALLLFNPVERGVVADIQVLLQASELILEVPVIWFLVELERPYVVEERLELRCNVLAELIGGSFPLDI